MKRRGKREAGLVWMRGLVPHILFLLHSLPLLPAKPGDREQTGYRAKESPRGPAGHRPSSHAGPGTRLFPPLKRGDGKRLALPCSQAAQTMMLVYSGGTSPSLLTCLHLLPRPAAHSPRPPSGGWRRGTAGPEGRGEAGQQLSTARAQNLKREDAGLGQWTELESRDPLFLG